jgi:hypothetical protein
MGRQKYNKKMFTTADTTFDVSTAARGMSKTANKIAKMKVNK